MVAALVLTVLAGFGPPKPFSFKGMFVEGCSCQKACAFELKGELPGCSGAGAYSFTSGTFDGGSLAGTRVAFAAGSAGWVRLYYDGPDERRRQTAKRFITTALKDWGKPEAVLRRSIRISGAAPTYTVTIDKGHTLNLKTVQGYDGPAKIHRNIFNKKLHPDIAQGQTRSCKFEDGKRKFVFSGSNAFYHSDLNVRGSL